MNVGLAVKFVIENNVELVYVILLYCGLNFVLQF
jgi:hypothetical protein